jgi:hypothetical protein
VNGKSYTRAWLPVQNLKSGTTNFNFKLAETPNASWGNGPTNALPSFTDGQAPAIGFIYDDDSLSIRPGGVAKFSLGMQKTVSGPLTLKWSASAPSGLELRPSSGMIQIDGHQRPRIDIQVIASAQIIPGSYAVPIRFQVMSRRALNVTRFPETVVEVKVSPSAATIEK